jgi:hypothetical protein
MTRALSARRAIGFRVGSTRADTHACLSLFALPVHHLADPGRDRTRSVRHTYDIGSAVAVTAWEREQVLAPEEAGGMPIRHLSLAHAEDLCDLRLAEVGRSGQQEHV